MVKKDQKSKFFFLLFQKIKSLVLSRIVVKRKLLWSFNMQKLHTWQISGSQVIMAKNGSQSMRFQYSLIVNISLID